MDIPFTVTDTLGFRHSLPFPTCRLPLRLYAAADQAEGETPCTQSLSGVNPSMTTRVIALMHFIGCIGKRIYSRESTGWAMRHCVTSSGGCPVSFRSRGARVQRCPQLFTGFWYWNQSNRGQHISGKILRLMLGYRNAGILLPQFSARVWGEFLVLPMPALCLAEIRR